MLKISSRFLAAVFTAFALTVFALGAHAQGATTTEPTLAQIYQAANAGQLDRADTMIEQVLKSHPNSAKAHYVKAELAAREGKKDIAKQELATAEKIAPGLPFAKAQSVQALRNQLANTARTASPQAQTQPQTQAQARSMGAAPVDAAPVRTRSGFPWGTLAAVAVIVVIGAAILRRRTAALPDAPNNASPYGQTGYGPVYPPGGMPQQQPQQPSMGSSILRGVGTGLAVGAGVVAAEEIGRRMFGHEANAAPLSHDTGNTPSLDQIDEGMRHNLNTDMGGDDFGVNDGGSWDDGGGGGGGDWDS